MFGVFAVVQSHQQAGIDVLHIVHPHANIDIDPNVGPNVDAHIVTDDDTDTNAELIADVNVDARVNTDVFKFYDTLRLYANSDTNIARIIILLGWDIDATVFR
ncbi:hypothetical protein PVK06_038674 [Gossypium arboreum]|uniref:Uncharacterized protein n=1 Tax=Gossypium arboreum TaxID=29729 RepID=A0ABR0N3E0_GOSAR|nr:hypothetical protein PVK06_038674 [Gossypium arboreum]